MFWRMGLPQEAVSLSPEAIERLHSKLCDMRHSVNNHLTLLATALELFSRKPDAIPKMLDSMMEQPEQIRDEIQHFSEALETAFKITRY